LRDSGPFRDLRFLLLYVRGAYLCNLHALEVRARFPFVTLKDHNSGGQFLRFFVNNFGLLKSFSSVRGPLRRLSPSSLKSTSLHVFFPPCCPPPALGVPWRAFLAPISPLGAHRFDTFFFLPCVCCSLFSFYFCVHPPSYIFHFCFLVFALVIYFLFPLVPFPFFFLSGLVSLCASFFLILVFCEVFASLVCYFFIFRYVAFCF